MWETTLVWSVEKKEDEHASSRADFSIAEVSIWAESCGTDESKQVAICDGNPSGFSRGGFTGTDAELTGTRTGRLLVSVSSWSAVMV